LGNIENDGKESISKKTNIALILGEGKEIEYKESLSGLSREDLVAFANSERGGIILIGVKQIEDEDGNEIGKVIGCDVGDRYKQKITNMAENCHPTVELEIEEEEQNEKLFYRVGIPSDGRKPYCTSGGKYKIRGDACTETLTPDRLLSMFLEEESNTFLSRFNEATTDLENKLDIINSKFNEEMKNVLENLEKTTARINGYLDNIDMQTKEAIDISSEANINSDEALGVIYELKEEIAGLKRYILKNKS